MFSNNVNCDIYVGQGAGKKLLDDILNARESIKIICPYLSPSLVSELIALRARGISVKLITTSDIEDYKELSKKNIYKLIEQVRNLDEAAVKKRNRYSKFKKVSLLFFFLSLFIWIALLFFFKDVNLLVGGLLLVTPFIAAFYYSQQFRNTRIYTYSYQKLFPFKVFYSEYDGSNSSFIHSKVFIIDDKIAYLGSLNFTYKGTKSNHETRIRTTDKNALGGLIQEFEDLYYSGMPEKDVQTWGPQIYREPIN